MAALEIEERWSDGVWRGFMESLLGLVLMATRENIIWPWDFCSSVFPSWIWLHQFHPAKVFSVILQSSGQKILTKVEDDLQMTEMFFHVRGKPKLPARKNKKHAWMQHNSWEIRVSLTSRTES